MVKLITMKFASTNGGSLETVKVEQTSCRRSRMSERPVFKGHLHRSLTKVNMSDGLLQPLISWEALAAICFPKAGMELSACWSFQGN